MGVGGDVSLIGSNGLQRWSRPACRTGAVDAGSPIVDVTEGGRASSAGEVV